MNNPFQLSWNFQRFFFLLFSRRQLSYFSRNSVSQIHKKVLLADWKEMEENTIRVHRVTCLKRKQELENMCSNSPKAPKQCKVHILSSIFNEVKPLWNHWMMEVKSSSFEAFIPSPSFENYTIWPTFKVWKENPKQEEKESGRMKSNLLRVVNFVICFNVAKSVRSDVNS